MKSLLSSSIISLSKCMSFSLTFSTESLRLKMDLPKKLLLDPFPNSNYALSSPFSDRERSPTCLKAPDCFKLAENYKEFSRIPLFLKNYSIFSLVSTCFWADTNVFFKAGGFSVFTIVGGCIRVILGLGNSTCGFSTTIGSAFELVLSFKSSTTYLMASRGAILGFSTITIDYSSS